jgi:hypothetical protein
MMTAIGLIPSDTAKPGGKQTGDCVSHYIEPGGPFALVVEQLLATGFEITWMEATTRGPSSPDIDGTGQADAGGSPYGARGSRSGRRCKYSCPYGDLNVWAKHGAEILCGRHMARMESAGRAAREFYVKE